MNKHWDVTQFLWQAAMYSLQASLWQPIIHVGAEFLWDRGISGWGNTGHSRSTWANPHGDHSWLRRRKPFSFDPWKWQMMDSQRPVLEEDRPLGTHFPLQSAPPSPSTKLCGFYWSTHVHAEACATGLKHTTVENCKCSLLLHCSLRSIPSQQYSPCSLSVLCQQSFFS